VKTRGLLDTGPLVAFIDRRDRFHQWSVDALSHFEPPLFTCDAVIAEAWHLLGRAQHGRDTLLALLQSGDVVISFSLASDLPTTLKLMKKYSDQPMSVADGCLVRMAELDPKATVVTLDSDFKVYRRGRSALRLEAPFFNPR
jgi:predicted nucleic acid-binding protein